MPDLATLELRIETKDVSRAKSAFAELVGESSRLEEGVRRVEKEFTDTTQGASRLANEIVRTEDATLDSKKAWAELVESTRAVETGNQAVAESGREVAESERRAGEQFEETGHHAGVLGHGLAELGHLVRDLFAAFALYRIVEEAKEALFEFDEADAHLRAIVLETTHGIEEQTAAFAALEEESKRVGTTTQFSAGAAKDAYAKLIASGFDVETSITAANKAMELSEARSLSLGEATEITSRLLKAFGGDASSVESILDQLTLASIRTPGGITRISDALSQLAPVATSLHLPLSDLIGSVTVLSQLPGGQRGVGALRELLFGLVDPTDKAAEKIRKLEERVGSLDPRTTKLADIILRLRDANLSLDDATDIFNRRAATGILLLTQSADKIAEWSDRSSEAVGITHRLAEENDKNLGESFSRLKATVETVITTGTSLTGGLRRIVDTSTDVIRVLFDVDDKMAHENHTAVALADSISLVGKALLYVVPVVAITQLALLAEKTILAKGVLEGLYAVVAAHPFGAILTAIGLVAVAFANFRHEVVDTREELGKLGAAIDLDRIERFTKRVDELTASLAEARKTGNARRELDAQRGILDELNAEADALQGRLREFGSEARVPVEEFRKTLANLSESLGVDVKVRFETEVLKKDARDIGDDVRKNILDRLQEGRGDLTPDRDFGSLGLRQAASLDNTREQLLRGFLPEGRFKVQAVSREDASKLFAGIEEAIEPFRKDLLHAFDIGDTPEVNRLFASINARLGLTVEQFLLGQKQISFGAQAALTEIEKVAEGTRSQIDEMEKELAKEKPKKPATLDDEGADIGGEAPPRARARDDLDKSLQALRAENEERQAALGLDAPEAAAAVRRIQFERLLKDAQLEDRDAAEAKRHEFEKLNAELLKQEQAKASSKVKVSDEVGGGGSSKTLGAFRSILDARLDEAQAVFQQGASLADFVEHLQDERRELEATVGLDQEKAQQVRELIQLEKLLKSAEGVDDGTKDAVFEKATAEIEALRQLRQQKRELAQTQSGDHEATRESIDDRLAEAEAVLKSRGSVDAMIGALRSEREAREKKLGLSAEEIEAYDRLAKVEKMLGDAAQLTGKERSDALAAAAVEIQQLKELRHHEDELAIARAAEKEQRVDAARAVDSQHRENDELQDQIDLLDARSDKEREIVALRASTRLQSSDTDAEAHSLRELLELLGEEIRRRLQLRSILADRAASRTQLQESVRSAREGNLGLARDVEVESEPTAAGRAGVLARAAATPTPTTRELQDDSEDDLLKKLQQELALRQSLEASAKTVERTKAIKDETEQLESQLRFQRLQVGAIEDANDQLRRGVDPLEEQTRSTTAAYDKEVERLRVADELKDAFKEVAKGGFDFKAEGLDGLLRKFRELSALVEQVFKRSKLRLDIDAEETNRQVELVVQQIREEKLSLTQTNEEREVSTRLRGLEGRASEEQVEKVKREIRELHDLETRSQLGQELARSFTDGFRQIAEQGASLEDALKGTLRRILSAFEEAVFFKPLENFLTNAFAPKLGGTGGGAPAPTGTLPGSFALGEVFAYADGAEFGRMAIDAAGPFARRAEPFAAGASFDRQAVVAPDQPFARRVEAFAGGNPFLNRVVDRPTVAPLALFGEAGPEAIVPLRDRGGLGVSAYYGGVELTSAPLKRGSDGRLGIDLKALLANLDELPDRRDEQPDRRRFEAGGVFSNRIEVVRQFAAGEAIERSLATYNGVPLPFGLDAATQERESALPQAPAMPQAIGAGSGSDGPPIVIHMTSNYHFAPGISPNDSFRRAAIQQERDARDASRRIFSNRGR